MVFQDEPGNTKLLIKLGWRTMCQQLVGEAMRTDVLTRSVQLAEVGCLHKAGLFIRPTRGDEEAGRELLREKDGERFGQIGEMPIVEGDLGLERPCGSGGTEERDMLYEGRCARDIGIGRGSGSEFVVQEE